MKKEKSCGAVVYKIMNNQIYFLIEKMQLGHYSLPKGHVESRESEIETAYREIKEETNLDVIIDSNFRETSYYNPTIDVLKEVVFFVAVVKDGQIKNQEKEVSEILFLTYEDAFSILTYKEDNYLKINFYN